MSRRTYDLHKGSAKQRGIPFDLTYEEWLSIWTASGRMAERGSGLNQYCMARFNDEGGYSIDNVRIITNAENSAEQHVSVARVQSTCKRCSKLFYRVRVGAEYCSGKC